MSKLFVHGIGTYIPKHRLLVSELAKAAGSETSNYKGWEMIGVAEEEEHPSFMATAALRVALEHAKISPDQLALVVSTGSTFDFLPSWSIANEAMKVLNAPSSCVGFDVNQGCVAGITAIEFGRDWLARSRANGFMAVICGQKWSYTIDRTDKRGESMWAWGDGGGAMVLGPDCGTRPLLEYLGSTYRTHARMHGMIHAPYGGTRSPHAPTGKNPHEKLFSKSFTQMEIARIYRENYKGVVRDAMERFDVKPDWLVCNHVSPAIVENLRELVGVPPERVCHRGNEIGHVGSSDVMFDLEELVGKRNLRPRETVFAVGSAQHTWACAVYKAPEK